MSAAGSPVYGYTVEFKRATVTLHVFARVGDSGRFRWRSVKSYTGLRSYEQAMSLFNVEYQLPAVA